MAKFFRELKGDREEIYEVANEWIERCLKQDGSLLHDNKQLWTLSNLRDFKLRFTDSPLFENDLTFDKKFEIQLKDAPKEIYELAMEILYMYYLFPRGIKYRTKLLKLKDIASWGNIDFDEDNPTIKVLDLGLGLTGTYYNTSKFEEISFLVQFTINFKLMTPSERELILSNPLELIKFTEETKDAIGSNVQMRHILSHFIAPDYFECIASGTHKYLIAKKFKEYVQNNEEKNLDIQIHEIRTALEKQYGEFTFYDPEIYEKWFSKPPKPDVVKETSPKKYEKDMNEDNENIDFSEPLSIDTLIFENEDMLLQQIQYSLKSGKHIILTGSPGTGKSKLADEICKQLGVKNKMVTATANWTTYDTIGGYRPNKQGELYFDPGLFLQCFKSKEGKNINEWLIIDEINRADIDKAFGSLFSVLTGDTVTLPYEGTNGEPIVLKPGENGQESFENEYVMPKDWRIIGTMNTFDKSSLFEMSYAFMRRFAFIPVTVPKDINKNLVESYLEVWSIPKEDYLFADELAKLWEIINQYRKIGPAIIQDIASYTIDNEDFTSALILYVMPQFEGLSDYKMNDFIRELKDKLSHIIKMDILKDFVKDFFQIGVDNE